MLNINSYELLHAILPIENSKIMLLTASTFDDVLFDPWKENTK